jgi:phospholipase C
MYVISPWSRGGWVNSQVFDHTSVIRLLEQRFGVMEPNITPWRRTVCGDLTSAFDFKTPNHAVATGLPPTKAAAVKAAALPGRATPATPAEPLVPVQAMGVRRSRALPYVLAVDEGREGGAIRLSFRNHGAAGAVFHVYDRNHLKRVPRRYTVGPGRSLDGVWEAGAYDLWVLGPNGFHRHFIGDAAREEPAVAVAYDAAACALTLSLVHPDGVMGGFRVIPNAYETVLRPWRGRLSTGARKTHRWSLRATHGWYDLSVRHDGEGAYVRRLAGRLETGAHAISDLAMGGPALMDQASFG